MLAAGSHEETGPVCGAPALGMEHSAGSASDSKMDPAFQERVPAMRHAQK